MGGGGGCFFKGSGDLFRLQRSDASKAEEHASKAEDGSKIPQTNPLSLSPSLCAFFFSGIIIFEEKVKDLFQTCVAFFFLILGLIGMSNYSAATHDDKAVGAKPSDHGISIPQQQRRSKLRRSNSISPEPPGETTGSSKSTIAPLEMEPLVAEDDEDVIMKMDDSDTKARNVKDHFVVAGRWSLTRRQLGILGAITNGAWGGMNLIPLHFALESDGLTGAGYLISYATGALIVNTTMWILLLAYHYVQTGYSFDDAVSALPKWHVQHLWRPGLFAGLLYSAGNFASILAVTYLGQGTGYSFCQMQLFVSGLVRIRAGAWIVVLF